MITDNLQSTIVKSLFSAWNSVEIIYCHWKSTDHLDASFEAITDLDVLVDPQSGNLAEVLALQCGFHPMRTAPLRTYPGVKDFVAYDESLQRFVHLHLHYQLVLGDRWVKAFRMPIEKQFLANRIWLEEFQLWNVHPIDEFAIYVCRMPVKFRVPYNPKSKAKVIKEAEHLIEQVQSSSHPYKVVAYTPAVDELAEKLPNVTISELAKTALKIRREMQHYRRMSKVSFIFLSNFRLFYRILIEIQRRKLKRFAYGRRNLSRSGRVIAFVGMDGAGKSSGIERNTKFFAQQMNVANVFLGSGQSGASWHRKLAFKILGTKKKAKKASSVNKSIKKHSFLYLLWIVLITYEKLFRLNRIFRHRAAGRLVFVDRWPQNTVHKMFDGSKFDKGYKFSNWLERFAKSLESKLFERASKLAPDAIIQFVVSPETSLERKPDDLSLEQAQQAKKDLEVISWPSTSKLVTINADQKIEEVDKELRAAIWQQIK